MKLLRVCWRLLLFFVAMSLFVSGLNCQVALLEEQDEEMLVVRVFAPIVEGENESLPIEGAQVYIWPDASKDPSMSKEAGREFYLDGVTDENGVVVFNLSKSLYYFNASIYHIRASAIHYATPVCLVNITETWEVSVYLGESPKQMRIPIEQTQPILSNPYFVLVLISTVAMGTAILVLSLKQRKANTHKSHKV